MKVVSLLPSSSEIVSALGFESALVGRSHECDHPVGVKRLPVCTELKIDVSGLTDGHHYFNRSGPRLVESTEILAEILHPDLFDFGHEGTGWRRFDSEPR